LLSGMPLISAAIAYSFACACSGVCRMRVESSQPTADFNVIC
jgi:hypothetical protein